MVDNPIAPLTSKTVLTSVTGPSKPPPKATFTPNEFLIPVLNPLDVTIISSVVIEKLSPLLIDAKLFDPGGSRRIISGTVGPLVTKVLLPSSFPPKIIPVSLKFLTA